MNDLYHPLHVGRAISDDLGYQGDDSGDNISEVNPLFGELTGIYWVWKNDITSDVIGVCHYRRFFANSEHQLLNCNEITDLMSKYDIITTMHSSGDITSYESFAKSHNIADYDILGQCLQELYPEYYDSFLYHKNECGGYFGNLMITTSQLYKQYCEWLFSILFKAAEYIDVSGYDLYHARIYGFLSEILMNVWLHHQQLNIYECPVVFTSEKAETVELKRAISNLVRDGKIEEARSLYYDITKIRPDVLLPESDISGELLLIEQILYIMNEESKQGVIGLRAVSDELPDIIKYYKTHAELWLKICSGRADTGEQQQFESSCISDIAKPVIERLFRPS